MVGEVRQRLRVGQRSSVDDRSPVDHVADGELVARQLVAAVQQRGPHDHVAPCGCAHDGFGVGLVASETPNVDTVCDQLRGRVGRWDYRVDEVLID